MRAAAAYGLGELGRSEAIPPLVVAFTSDPGLYVRCDAALALGSIGSDEAIPVLLGRFLGEEFEVQKRIVMALSKIGTKKARNALAEIKNTVGQLDSSKSDTEFLSFLVDEGLNTMSTSPALPRSSR
jgi:HEAT repeat protein